MRGSLSRQDVGEGKVLQKEEVHRGKREGNTKLQCSSQLTGEERKGKATKRLELVGWLVAQRVKPGERRERSEEHF